MVAQKPRHLRRQFARMSVGRAPFYISIMDPLGERFVNGHSFAATTTAHSYP